MPPVQYVKMRLLVMRELYQLKIPRCYAWRRFWELILTCCTVASATLSYLDSTSHYVAVSSSVAAAVTSWLSHVELSRRIERYSNTVRSINDLVWWWESFDDVERANAMNITKLIETGESVLATERLTWIAAARKNDEAAKDGDEDQYTARRAMSPGRPVHSRAAFKGCAGVMCSFLCLQATRGSRWSSSEGSRPWLGKRITNSPQQRIDFMLDQIHRGRKRA